MKKALTLILAACMVLTMTACGSGTASEGTAAEGETTAASEKKTTAAATEEVFLQSFDTSATIEETVLWDENDVKITATSLTYSSWSADLNLVIENNSEETLKFRSDTAAYAVNAVNGYMISGGYFNLSVDPGETGEADMSFGQTELQLHGINAIGEITVGVSVTDDDYNTIYLAPKTIETSAADSYDSDTDTFVQVLQNGTFARLSGYALDYFAADEVYSKSGITICAEALLSEEDDDSTSVNFMMEYSNQSDNDIYVVLTDVSLNGTVMYDGTWSSDYVSAGTRYVFTMDVNWLLEQGDQTDDFIADGIDSISFTVNIKNDDYNDALSPEEVTVTFR